MAERLHTSTTRSPGTLSSFHQPVSACCLSKLQKSFSVLQYAPDECLHAKQSLPFSAPGEGRITRPQDPSPDRTHHASSQCFTGSASYQDVIISDSRARIHQSARSFVRRLPAVRRFRLRTSFATGNVNYVPMLVRDVDFIGSVLVFHRVDEDCLTYRFIKYRRRWHRRFAFKPRNVSLAYLLARPRLVTIT